MALPLAMTMRSTTSGGKPFATIQSCREPTEPVIARRLGLNKVDDLSATELVVPSESCPSKEALDAAGTGAADAMGETLDQLDELLVALGESSGQ
jgi:hypothetical protein